MSCVIALDYDQTYTEDPEMWDRFILQAQARGHRVVMPTMRYEIEAIEGLADGLVEVFYTGRKAKRPWMENAGVKVDIWIDDSPGWIFNDAL